MQWPSFIFRAQILDGGLLLRQPCSKVTACSPKATSWMAVKWKCCVSPETCPAKPSQPMQNACLEAHGVVRLHAKHHRHLIPTLHQCVCLDPCGQMEKSCAFSPPDLISEWLLAGSRAGLAAGSGPATPAGSLEDSHSTPGEAHPKLCPLRNVRAPGPPPLTGLASAAAVLLPVPP